LTPGTCRAMSDDERKAFVDRYGGIYEHSPWVAEAVWDHGRGASGTALAVALAACVDNAGRERKLELICAHPDLAGRAAVAGELTAASSIEQSSAGLDRCSQVEFDRLQSLNTRYRDKFGFPFVMAVRDSSREQILEAFERRLANEPEAEFDTAITETHKIARLRLESL